MGSEELAAEIAEAVEEVEFEAPIKEVVEEVKDGEVIEVVETGETEVEETKVETTEETTPTLTDEILERAVGAGIPVVDARELTPDSLDRVIKAREAAWERAAQDAAPVKEKVVEEKVEDPFADMPKLDPDVHDASTIAYFDKLREIAKSQHETIQDFNTRQKETLSVTEAANEREVTRWFDGRVANLGEDFTEALGEGGYNSLTPGSPQFVKREELMDQVTVLLAGHRAIGRQAPSDEQVFDTAARLVLQKEYQQIYDKKLAGNLGKQAGQHIQRAGGQRTASKESPMEEAARLIDEKYPSGPGD